MNITLEAVNDIYKPYPQFKDTRVKLIGIRGYQLDESGENKLGIYDDAILSIIDDKVTLFVASVDPGLAYVENPISADGCADLCEGLSMFKFGTHKQEHPCLVQSGVISVYRLNKSGKRMFVDVGEFSIQIHCGGHAELVGNWSAGCQIIKSSIPWQAEWLEFFTPIHDKCKEIGQTEIPYVLVNRLNAGYAVA